MSESCWVVYGGVECGYVDWVWGFEYDVILKVLIDIFELGNDRDVVFFESSFGINIRNYEKLGWFKWFGGDNDFFFGFDCVGR